jgi:hypothetical protein
MAYPQAPIEMDMYMDSQQALTPIMGIPMIMSLSYSLTSTGKSKPVAYGTITLSPSYVRSTSSSPLLTASSTVG